jgi:23S rRNA (cytidine2498-2'-O)-methyltransferase
VDGYLCRGGYEDALARELGRAGAGAHERRPGLVLADVPEGVRPDPAFSSQTLPGVVRVPGESVAKLARAAFEAAAPLLDASEGAWVLHGYVPEAAELAGLASRAQLVSKEFLGLVKEKLRRAHRRMQPPSLPPPASRGEGLRVLQVAVTGRDEAFVSYAECRLHATGLGHEPSPDPLGRPAIADDRTAPSSAFKKVEEAYLLLGEAPREGETVVDLGAAPGGWSYTALRRGARVTAIDRAELLPPVAAHERLTHLRKDAFAWEPAERADWLLCDAIAVPERSIGLLDRWLEKGWCRRFVVNVKFKGTEDYGQVEKLRAVFARRGVARVRVKQLGADKNEVTSLGVC